MSQRCQRSARRGAHPRQARSACGTPMAPATTAPPSTPDATPPTRLRPGRTRRASAPLPRRGPHASDHPCKAAGPMVSTFAAPTPPEEREWELSTTTFVRWARQNPPHPLVRGTTQGGVAGMGGTVWRAVMQSMCRQVVASFSQLLAKPQCCNRPAACRWRSLPALLLQHLHKDQSDRIIRWLSLRLWCTARTASNSSHLHHGSERTSRSD